jgi:hypothetical protein
MAANNYHFITRWRVEGQIEEVADILGDARGLARWWPSVYLEVRELQPGDERGAGRVVDLYTKGWLPYTLRWQFQVTESRYPHGFTLAAQGDFVGRGIWTFEQAGAWVDVIYDWEIRADKPLLRTFSFMLKPMFAANHRWAMARGEESLRLELLRRRAATPEERASIPPPPPATTNAPFLAGVAASLVLAAGAGYRAVRRKGRA